MPGVELVGSSWSVRWGISDSCVAVISVIDEIHMPDPALGVVRGPRLEQHCSYQGSPSPLGGGSSTTRIEWIESLPSDSYAFDGDTVTWTLPPDTLPEAPAERLAFLEQGSSWTHLRALARDGRWLTETSTGSPVPVGVTGPGSFDWADPVRDFIVAEDAQA